MPSELERIADRQRAALLRLDQEATTRMVQAYAQSYQRIQQQLADLNQQIDAGRARGETISPAWLFRQERLQSLERQVRLEIDRFAQYADQTITAQQRQMVGLGQDHARELIQASQGPPPAGVFASFHAGPTEATQELVGVLADGSPLSSLLDELGPEASDAIRKALITGVTLGQNPREIARLIERAAATTLARALAISRTETLRAYRESSRQSYLANDDVVEGWIWHASLTTRTCASCWAMHGTKHKLSEHLDDHVMGRCAMVPLTKSWADLGFKNVPDDRPIIETGAEAFRRLAAGGQQAILGPAKYALYVAGKIALEDLVERDHSHRWGTMRREATVREALVNARG